MVSATVGTVEKAGRTEEAPGTSMVAGAVISLRSAAVHRLHTLIRRVPGVILGRFPKGVKED